MLTKRIKGRKNKLIIAVLISILICSSNINTKNLVKADIVMWLNLVLKTSGDIVRPDICFYIADYLEDIGIDVSIIVEEWGEFMNTLFLF